MRVFLHAWLPVLLLFGLMAAGVLWVRKRDAEKRRPLSLAEQELAPWYPWGAHPVVIPQTFVITPSVAPAPPPIVGAARPVVAA